MAERQDDIEAHALDWVVRVGDATFEDWAAFQSWLEADPRHASAYHAMSDDIASATAMLPPEPAPRSVVRSVPPRSRRPAWKTWAGGAIAASLALTIGYAVVETRSDPYVVETAAGAMRTVHLAEGSAITLGGATRLVLDRRDVRTATLERGEAMFVVRHDDHDPFKVHVGNATLFDVGTAFDVRRVRSETRVAVSEGAVDYISGGVVAGRDGLRLKPGEGLVARDGQSAVSLIAVDAASVGSWRNSVLVYRAAPLAEVADDLSRALALDLRVDPAIAMRPFSGSIATAKLANDPTLLAPLLNIRMTRRGNRWMMTAPL